MEQVHTYTNNQVQPLRGAGVQKSVRLTSNLALTAGTLVIPELAASASEVQTLTITGTPTAGSTVLSFNGYSTDSLPITAAATAVQAALAALPNIGTGNITCSGGPWPTGIVCTFGGALANLPQPAITKSDSFSGGSSPATVIAETTAGVANGRFKAYAGTGVPSVLRYDVSTDEKGRHYYGLTAKASQHGGFLRDTPVFIGGVFKKSDLGANLDATAVTNMHGRWLTGSISDDNAELEIPAAP